MAQTTGVMSCSLPDPLSGGDATFSCKISDYQLFGKEATPVVVKLVSFIRAQTRRLYPVQKPMTEAHDHTAAVRMLVDI